MKKDPELYLRDILEAIQGIKQYVHGIQQEEFFKDQKTQDAVLRKLGIIGEASIRLPESLKAAYPQIPWNMIAGMRNVLIHDYTGVNLDVIWDTVHVDIPRLEKVVRTMKDALPMNT